MIPVELQDAFYAGRRGDVVKFVINDSVEVTSGEHEGCVGAIISVEEVEPAVVYLVERGDNGSSIFVPQSCLKLLEGEASLTNRGKVLQELIEFRRKPTEMHAILEAFEWDLEEELVQLEKIHVVAVLQRFLHDEVSREEVENWANLIECRDDIGYEEVAEVLHVLANPEITDKLTKEVAARLIHELAKPLCEKMENMKDEL